MANMFGTAKHSDHNSDCKGCQTRQAKKKKNSPAYAASVNTQLVRRLFSFIKESPDSCQFPIHIL